MVKLTRLRTVRERKALTQQELAERAGVSRPTVARIETYQVHPYPTTVRKIAEALGVYPEALMEPESTSHQPGARRRVRSARSQTRGRTSGKSAPSDAP
ncbi:MAG: helix-turn-helix transcriptional regulator [Chloroflexota bacterium]